MNNDPLVTVYIPTYNRRLLLQRALESVLQQTYSNIEIIVVDDGSSDETINYLASISSEDPRVRFFQNNENSGACVSRNKAIYEARGEFITGLDDDDYFLKNRISNFLIEWAKLEAGYVALYSNLHRKTSQGLRKSYRRISGCKAEELIYSNWIGNQLFTKTSSLKNIGGFSEGFPAWQDLDCWYRLLKNEGGMAKNCGDYSYILDVSHPHERISNKSIEKIEDAWSLFCYQNNLNDRQRLASRLMLLNYSGGRPSLKAVMYKLFGMPKWHNLRHCLILFYLSIKL